MAVDVVGGAGAAALAAPDMCVGGVMVIGEGAVELFNDGRDTVDGVVTVEGVCGELLLRLGIFRWGRPSWLPPCGIPIVSSSPGVGLNGDPGSETVFSLVSSAVVSRVVSSLGNVRLCSLPDSDRDPILGERRYDP